jgi:hypothetical protein
MQIRKERTFTVRAVCFWLRITVIWSHSVTARNGEVAALQKSDTLLIKQEHESSVLAPLILFTEFWHESITHFMHMGKGVSKNLSHFWCL